MSAPSCGQILKLRDYLPTKNVISFFWEGAILLIFLKVDIAQSPPICLPYLK